MSSCYLLLINKFNSRGCYFPEVIMLHVLFICWYMRSGEQSCFPVVVEHVHRLRNMQRVIICKVQRGVQQLDDG